jgi:hypothetical protein
MTRTPVKLAMKIGLVIDLTATTATEAWSDEIVPAVT